MNMERKYIVDEKNHRIAVQLDIATFNKIEEILENYALFHLMTEDADDEILDFEHAKEYYGNLEKQQ